MRRLIDACLTLTLCVGLGAATVSPAPAAEHSRGGWSLGAGAIASSRPYPGAGGDLIAIPFIGYEGERAYLRGLIAGLRQAGPRDAEFDLFVRARMQRFDASDAPVVEGMETRRRTAEAGVGARFGPRWLRGRAALARDVLGRHEGEELTLTASVPVLLQGTLISFTAGGSWQSASLTEYYYGVRPEEARDDRPAYRPGAAWNWRAGAMARRSLGGRWSGMLIVQHEWMDGNLRRSPITDGGRRWFGLAAVSYVF